MIYSITGIIKEKSDGIIIIENNGIAYILNVSNQTLSASAPLGDEATFYTFLNVKEDDLELFGFENKKELELFKLLITVKGVGARSALTVLSGITMHNLTTAIISGDYKMLMSAKGIGKRTAEQIILDLKDKIAKQFEEELENISSVSNIEINDYSNIKEAMEALSSLGYSYNDARHALVKADPNASVEKLIKIALKNLG